MSTAQSRTKKADSTLDDLQKQYEEARSKNQNAKKRLAELQGVTVGAAKDSVGATVTSKTLTTSNLRQTHLESHLKNLRLQKRQKSFQILSQHCQDAEQIERDENILDAFDLSFQGLSESDASSHDQQAALAETKQYLNALLEGSKIMTSQLELALVKARQQLKREKYLSDKDNYHLQDRRDGAVNDVDSGRAKLRALEVVRDELQTWIGEGLARCEQNIALIPGEDLSSPEGFDQHREQISDKDITTPVIEQEYERYLESRKRLVRMVEALRMPLKISPTSATTVATLASPSKPQAGASQSTSTTEDQKQRIAMQRAPHLRHKSRVSVHKVMEQIDRAPLVTMETVHIPGGHHEKLLSTYSAHLTSQSALQDDRLLRTLGLLSHESHLLPSYPIPSFESTRTADEDDMSQQQTEIDHLLTAWAFASQSADMTLMTNVMGNIEEARLALDRAGQCVDDIHIVEEMRKNVAAGKR